MIVNDSMLLFGVCFGTLLLQICGLPEDCSNDRSVGKALLQRQLHLGDSMHSMNSVSKVLSLKAAQSTGDTKALFESFSICGQCKAWQRFGESHDGGYLSCMDHMEKSDLRAAYSMGVSHHDKWSSDVFTKFNIPVYQYDCTVAAPAEDCAQCHFFQACLQSELDPTAKNLTLREAVNQHTKNRDVTKKARKRSLLMKMDIEGAEWKILAQSDLQTLSNFRQLVIEFHGLQREDRHAEYLAAMKRLHKAGFQVVHVHGNNCCDVYSKDGLAIPEAIEVTLDAMSEKLDSCENPTTLDLDMRNLKDLPDIQEYIKIKWVWPENLKNRPRDPRLWLKNHV